MIKTDSTKTTLQVASVTSGGQKYSYTYDNMGNIATFSAPGKGTVTYTYDNQGQLLKAAGDTTYTYTYDGAGNILTASNGTTSHTYTYGNTDWKDLLTAFDGNSITYDAIGNPTSYYNGTRWTMSWVNGRSLATASDGTNNLSFAYDADGLRTRKIVGGVTHNYLYAGGKLMRETYGSNTLDFFYDANGAPYALKYNGTVYYYITNLQGDVMRIVNASGTVMASYDYDPYGKVISATGTLANVNPLRYRGYVYDTETGFYYLQSRYYDPVTCRFVNADSLTSTGQGIIGHNMFAYCGSNPINRIDQSGTKMVCQELLTGGGKTNHKKFANEAAMRLFWGVGLCDPLPALPEDGKAVVENISVLSFGFFGFTKGHTIVMDNDKYCEYFFWGIAPGLSATCASLISTNGIVYGVNNTEDYCGLFLSGSAGSAYDVYGGAWAPSNGVHSVLTSGTDYLNLSLGGSITWYYSPQEDWIYGAAPVVSWTKPGIYNEQVVY